MKTKFYSLFFLLILTGYILRPVLPIVEYALNKDYISKNLCVNRDKPKSCCEGKCHLKKELAKSDTSNDAEENNNSKKTGQKHIDEFIKTSIKTSNIFEIKLYYPFLTSTKALPECTTTIFVPPRFLNSNMTV